eukprot:TRINITY_DN1705_c0_g2_i1.p1 TRINITY_DN1705_c0_g2~~TRINITY_DN1705_c0_g2_i1.p1  ORF type:complete len:370 (-),score=97.09 TRINITY_DN1705_c0_g2_i1:716-1825(-)
MEATLICIDNSEWTRSGDFSPTRYRAQLDAVNLLAMSKTEMNPENAVGIMTMAGKTPKVLVTLTNDLGKILNSVLLIDYESKCNLASTLKIAQLALKHRQNKNQQQRIVLFIGSPVEEDQQALVKIGKQLKKVNVAVDIISFGEDGSNEEKLSAFIEAVNGQDNSHLFSVPAGTILSDALIGTTLFQGGEGGGFGGVGGVADMEGVQNGFPGDVNPELDPELALALRMSIEEEKQRQEAMAKAQSEAAQGGDQSAQGGAAGSSNAVDEMELDDDAALQEALKMSITPEGGAADVDMDEQDELQLAIKLSQTDTSEPPPDSSSAQDFSQVLAGLPGVDPEKAMKIFNEQQSQGEKEKSDKEKSEKKDEKK